MLKSMTGFGKATCEFENKTINIEIRSLNSKQMDIMMRIPQHYKEKELAMRNIIAQSLVRGKVDVQVWIDGDGEKNVSINQSIVKKYYDQLTGLNEQLGANSEGKDLMKMIMRLPDVFDSARQEISDEEWKAVEGVVVSALVKLNEFRAQEGKALEKDMQLCIETIQEKSLALVEFEEERGENIRAKLQTSLDTIGVDVSIDKDRFEQEVIYYLDKYDINEEKVRLANHCVYFIETLVENKSNGKKLGFIAQEIGREINTLGSKANHSQIQRFVVQMKEELEKIKEQVLNSL